MVSVGGFTANIGLLLEVLVAKVSNKLLLSTWNIILHGERVGMSYGLIRESKLVESTIHFFTFVP